MPEREPDFRVTRLEGDVGELVLNVKSVSYRSADGTTPRSDDMTDKEYKALARGILLADRKSGGWLNWMGAIFVALILWVVVLAVFGSVWPPDSVLKTRIVSCTPTWSTEFKGVRDNGEIDWKVRSGCF